MFREIRSEKVKIIVSDFIFPRSFILLQFGHCVPCVTFMFCELVVLQRKVKVVHFARNLAEYLKDNDSYSNISFLDFQS